MAYNEQQERDQKELEAEENEKKVTTQSLASATVL